MEEFLFLVVVVLVLLVLVLFHRVAGLRERLSHIEQYLQKATEFLGGATPGDVRTPQEAIEGAPAAAVPAEDASWRQPVAPTGPDPFETFVAWIKTDWLMKLGGAIFILGMAWFVNFAFERDWIGPQGRIALGFAVGAALIALGRRRIETYRNQGTVLMFVGALSVILVMWAAREFYGYFDHISALVIMFATSCLLGATGVVLSYRPLAYANVALAAIAPLLIVPPDTTRIMLLAYLLVLALGAVWVAAVRGWREIIFMSLAVTALYSPSILDVYPLKPDHDAALMFAFIFTGVYFAASLMGMRQRSSVSTLDILTAFGSGLYLLSWVLISGQEDWQSMLLVAWTLVFASGAFMAVRQGAGQAYFFTYASVGVLLLGAATALELEGPALTIAYIIEATLLVLLGYHVSRKTYAIPVLFLPAIVPVALSLGSMDVYDWHKSIFHEHALVLILMVAAAAVLAKYFHDERLTLDEEGRHFLAHVRDIVATVGGVYATIFTWLASHALFTQDAGTTVALFIYTLVASMLYMASRHTGGGWRRAVAIGLFVLVAGRLAVVEVWHMDLGPQVVTFLIIGSVIMAVAYMERGMRSEHGTDGEGPRSL